MIKTRMVRSERNSFLCGPSALEWNYGELIAFLMGASMKREWRQVICLGLLNLSLVPASSSLLQAQNKSQNKVEKEAAPMRLKVGDTAPDFTLLAFDEKELKTERWQEDALTSPSHCYR